MPSLVKIAVSLLPVFVFLAGLVYLDSYQLVPFRRVLVTIAIGCLVAIVGLFSFDLFIALFNLQPPTYSRYVAPVIEESAKALYVIFLLRTKRIGFMVDAAILGFAVGAGFALLENIDYLRSVSTDNPVVWIIRGFGTAVMHGGTTAIFAVASKSMGDEHTSQAVRFLVPGFAIAVAIHSFFNHFFITPLETTLAIVVVLPTVMFLVFRQSERSTREWLGVGFDTDADLLNMIVSGNISKTKVGEYLAALQHRMRAEVVVDMLCYMRIYLELSIQAKGILLMREAGFDVPMDPHVGEKLDELKFLERSIGKTGKRALVPLLRLSDRDLWQLRLLVTK
ncbi:MAG TPA: hypothetical protein DCP63_10750 [Bacteroidetes bacterium]|nr:hypothetical protein [Bacteroidota bacterium]